MASRKWQVAAYGPADNLQLASFNKPDPKQGEVVVKVLSTTATYTDLMIITVSLLFKHGTSRLLIPGRLLYVCATRHNHMRAFLELET